MPQGVIRKALYMDWHVYSYTMHPHRHTYTRIKTYKQLSYQYQISQGLGVAGVASEP
jgi:hypothetical protein